jgi:hypothetical protein
MKSIANLQTQAFLNECHLINETSLEFNFLTPEKSCSRPFRLEENLNLGSTEIKIDDLGDFTDCKSV